MVAIRSRLYELLEQVCVMQGFVGLSYGETTMLGRGGSDYGAAIVTEGLRAEKLLIYTNVPGVYTMDPNVLPFDRQIDGLSFQDVAEMASFGARILHPATLSPGIRSRIPTCILFALCKGYNYA